MNRLKHKKLNPTVLSKVTIIVLLDVFFTALAFFLGLWFRFDFVFADISDYFIQGYMSNVGIWCTITVGILALFNLYNCIWVFVRF